MSFLAISAIASVVLFAITFATRTFVVNEARNTLRMPSYSVQASVGLLILATGLSLVTTAIAAIVRFL